MESPRTSRIEIDLLQLRKNLEILRKDMPLGLQWCSVLKDNAYGHGAVEIGRETVSEGASYVAVSTMNEALELKTANINVPILIFGERSVMELATCIENQFIFFVNDISQAKMVSDMGKKQAKQIQVHTKIDTGLSRYGIRWTEAVPMIESISNMPNLHISGIMTHFAMSDELDKSFAYQQLARFEECVGTFRGQKKFQKTKFHVCNTGGYLDLPKAHHDFVRIGILPLGVYPSKFCRRISGIKPIMSVHTQVATVKKIEPGDIVGYGLRYRAESVRTIAILPMGYSSGFPRLRNRGFVLIHGKKAPIIGGNSMNAMMVDVSDIPQTKIWDEVTIVGSQLGEEISIHDLAGWDETVSYEIMARWSSSLPRIYKI